MGKRRQMLRRDLPGFLQQYGRRSGPQHVNDRSYDRRLEDLVKRLPPEELDRLLRDEDDQDLVEDVKGAEDSNET